VQTNTLLPDAEHLRLECLRWDGSQARMLVSSSSATAACPKCGQPSQRVHSRYRPTDAQAAAPTTEPVGVDDLLYTISTLMGINPAKQYFSPLGRPVPIVDGGKMIRELV